MGGLVGRTCNYCHLKEFTGTWSTPETPSPTGPCDGSRRRSGVVASGRSSRVSGVAGCRTDEGTSLTQQKAMIEKFCRPIVGRGGRKGRQTGQVLPGRPIRVADPSGDDDDERSLWPKKHPRPRPKARTASLDANMHPCRLLTRDGTLAGLGRVLINRDW